MMKLGWTLQQLQWLQRLQRRRSFSDLLTSFSRLDGFNDDLLLRPAAFLPGMHDL